MAGAVTLGSRVIRAAVALILSLGGPAAAGPFENAQSAYEREDYKTAFELWLALAERGDANAQYQISHLYQFGQGVTKDHTEALNWLKRSAQGGNAKAQYSLGNSYDSGARGLPKDDAEAAKWYRRAGDQGHAPAQLALGSLYQWGWGVPRDEGKAAKWYRRAAQQGDAGGQSALGRMYRAGSGVPQDYVLAYMWFNLAAAACDNPEPTSSRGAYRKLIRGMQLGLCRMNRNHRDKLANKMTNAQIAEAQERTRQWKAKPEANAGK